MARDIGLMGLIIEIQTSTGPLKVSADPGKQGDVEAAHEALRIALQANPIIGQTQPPASPYSPRLSEVRERLKAHKAGRRISPSTLSEYLSTLEEFIAWKGDIPIRTLTGRDIGDFAHYMLEERSPTITPRTWDKKLNAVNALFAQATRDGDWDKKDEYPTVGHFRFKKKRRDHAAAPESGYRAFTNDELGKVFDPVQFRTNAREPHDYWLPILGYLTGGRLNELSQLLVTDVKQHEGVWVIHITDAGHPKKRVKSDAGRRMVPLHPKLIVLGFLEYVKIAGGFAGATFPFSGLLFPYLSHSEKNGFAGAPSKRFARYLERLGVKDEQLVFHSLRKNFNQNLLNRKVHVEHRSRLMGQAFDSVNSEVYGTDLPLNQVLRDFIEPFDTGAIDVEALKLEPKVFADQLFRLLARHCKEQERQQRLKERNPPYVARPRARILRQ